MTSADNSVPHANRYSSRLFITPRSGQHNGRDWQNNQKSLRSVVETVFAVVKWFSLAGGKYRGSPELQQLALGCIYQLVAQNLNNYPLRISLEAKGKPFKAFGQ